MFEAYRIRPVVEWEGSDESCQLEPFNTLAKASEAHRKRMRSNPDEEPHIFWTLYGVNPEALGVRTEDAIADVDSEEAALEMLEKLIGRFEADPRAAGPGYYLLGRSYALPSEADQHASIEVSVSLRIDLNLLRIQKRALVNVGPHRAVTSDQAEVLEGILSLLDFIQDAVVDLGLATEAEVFDISLVSASS